MLRGMGVSMTLPMLEAMRPAAVLAAEVADPTRLVCIEMVHGAAGSNELGATKNLWAPAATGADFDLSTSSMSPLEPFRDYLTIISNTDVRNAEAFSAREVGGDHFRSSAVFLTQQHPHQTYHSLRQSGRRGRRDLAPGGKRRRKGIEQYNCRQHGRVCRQRYSNCFFGHLLNH